MDVASKITFWNVEIVPLLLPLLFAKKGMLMYIENNHECSHNMYCVCSARYVNESWCSWLIVGSKVAKNGVKLIDVGRQRVFTSCLGDLVTANFTH